MIGGLVTALLGLAPVPQERMLEVPLAPLVADASARDWMDRSGLSPSLRERLPTLGISGVVLWLPPGLDAGPWPEEPRCQWARAETLADGTPGAIQALLLELEEQSLRVALGRRAARPQAAPSRRLLVETIEGERRALERMERPDVTPFLWYDPEWYPPTRSFPDLPWVVDLASLTPLPEDLRATQLFLDLLAVTPETMAQGRSGQWSALLQQPLWRQEGEAPLPPAARRAAAHRLLRQSRLATYLAQRLAPDEPTDLRPFQNLRRSPQDTRERADLHPSDGLDLQHWSLRPFPAGQDPELLTGIESVPADHSEVPGILNEGPLTALERWASARWKAARSASRWWLSGQAEDLAPVRVLVLAADRARRELPEALRPLHRPGIDELTALEQEEPFRIFASRWQVGLKGPGEGVGVVDEVLLRRAQDDRFGGAAQRLLEPEQSLSLQRYWRHLAGRTVVLRTEIPTSQPRTWRLALAGPFTASVSLNGVLVADQQDLSRTGGLTLALDLAAALNEVEVHLLCGPSSDRLQLDWWPVPHALEGLLLTPAQCREVQAPLIRVEAPVALHGTLLAIPRDRPLRPAEQPVAEFVFPTALDQRWDLWVHGSLPAGAKDMVTVQVDGRPEETVPFVRDRGWQWVRMSAPYTLTKGDHQLLLSLAGPGVLVDSLHLIPTGSRFPGPPAGDRSLGDHAWRYQPLGRGHRFEIPAFDEPRRLAGTYKTERTGHYRAYVWMKGTRPLGQNQTAEIELATSANVQRVFLPQGTPVEEWVPVGFLDLTAEEPLTLRSRGDGAPAYLCLVPARPEEG